MRNKKWLEFQLNAKDGSQITYQWNERLNWVIVEYSVYSMIQQRDGILTMGLKERGIEIINKYKPGNLIFNHLYFIILIFRIKQTSLCQIKHGKLT